MTYTIKTVLHCSILIPLIGGAMLLMGSLAPVTATLLQDESMDGLTLSNPGPHLPTIIEKLEQDSA